MRSRLTYSTWWPYLLVGIVWAVTRAYPLAVAVPWTYWDVWEAQKLLDYGFWHRLGAIINIHYMAGLVPDPWKFNYVNHPYPILWANTLAYYLGGQWAALLFNSAIGLGGCLAAYPALRWFYSEKESLWGAILFTVVPINVIFNVNPDLSGVAASFWPFTIWAMAAARAKPTQGRVWLLGTIIFLSGQVSWSTYSFYPLLLLGAVGPAWERGHGFAWDPRPAVVKTVLAGVLLTGLVFLAQIVFYTPVWSELTAYIGRQAASDQGVSLARMYLAILLRSALSVGPSLLLGSLAFLVLLPRLRRLDWPQLCSLLYPLLFALCALFLRRYFYSERHLYCYLAFPMVILTLETMRVWRERFWWSTIAGLAVAGLIYPMFQATIPVVSETSRQLGQQLQTFTKPQQVIATNLAPQHFPFPAWDVGSTDTLALAADRNLRPIVDSRAALENILTNFKAQRLEILYVLDPGRPADNALIGALNDAGPARKWRFSLPVERSSPALHLRNFYWYLTARHQAPQTNNAEREITLQLFWLLLERGPEGKTIVSRLGEQ